ncbi:MAG: sigma-70 family RNA polymerase sigma factor [Proteobacteria bacterium]|nr:sigma-70 family RNA polymerase sigma factor [Pseudomonadota bacterium]MBU1611779.1 sigma-70 family RNA polymerase sigma factor [Pseudomonadota bacterium]
MHDTTDFETIGRVLDGNVDAYAVLVRRYQPEMFRIVSGHVPTGEVAAVAHDAFVRAYGSLAGYRPTKPFVRWLTTITLRTCHDFWRSRYRNREISVSELPEARRLHMLHSATGNESDPALVAEQNQERMLLNWALEQLSPLDRIVVTMTHLEELSSKETAELLDMSVTNVKVRAFRARKKLKAILESVTPQGGGGTT